MSDHELGPTLRSVLDGLTAEVRGLRAEVAGVRAEVAALRRLAEGHAPPPPRQAALPFALPPDDQLVSLNQAAAMVHLSKEGLRRYHGRGLPAPRRKPHRGQPALYSWGEMRPWLQATFSIVLPDNFPGMAG